MKHVYTFFRSHFVVCLVAHEELYELDIAMKACEMEWIVALLRFCRCVDPIGHSFFDLLLEHDDHI